MADERSRGVVLRTRPMTETSLIVNWLTPDLGRIATVAKGARRPKSPFRGKLDFAYEAEFSFQRSRRSDLHTLREVGLLETHPALRRDIDVLGQAAYFAVLVEQSTETETPIPEIYQLFQGVMTPLELHPPQVETVLGFEIKMLDAMGLSPDWDDSRLSEGSRRVARWLATESWDGIFRVRTSPAQTSELRRFLQEFLLYHLERVPSIRARALKCESPQSSRPAR
ncbi:MAG: DNA repair protein RecO [Verrucomicrobia bacterium]|nr:DNA repair protein RecO [Verrucomicrobiota bacterium]MBI3869876.1 DNA repair protein RecO [Verrucomicrobiota bacterium]